MVVNGPDCNVKTYVKVHNKVTSYADLLKAIFILKDDWEVADEDANILKMCMIKDELWCSCTNKIRIFNRDCVLLREINLDRFPSTFGFTKGPNDAVFLALADGCVLLNSDYGYDLLMEGNFADVCYYNKCLYAVDYMEKIVYILEDRESKWENKFEWEVEDAIALDSNSKMFVNRFGVFISSRIDKRIYQFSHNGNLQQTAGGSSMEEDDENVAGILNYPIMCGVDSHGIVLIGDYMNHTFQLYNSIAHTWQVINNLEKKENPIYAVLDGNDLFISIRSRLLKYKLE